MASYVDELTEDRGRVLKALATLIEEQEEMVRDLTEAVAEYREALDRAIIRTMIYRNMYGPSQALTMMAEKDAQDASSPVNETTLRLERETQILHVFRDAAAAVEKGEDLTVALARIV
jgi:hypothetical protein